MTVGLKYKLGDKHPYANLYRVVALRDIERFGVKTGDIGGYVETEANLSQHDAAWISGDARVYGNACVSGNACVYGNARVYGDACVSGNARVSGDACVYGDACVSGNARVSGNACVYGNARVYGDACVSGDDQLSRLEDLLNVIVSPYSVTVTPQNIRIGCQSRSRFGADQWTSKGQAKKDVETYAPLLKWAKKQVPRKRAVTLSKENT